MYFNLYYSYMQISVIIIFNNLILNKIYAYFMSAFIRENSISTHFKNHTNWIVLSSIEQDIKEKIERNGKPLREWDIKIYRGILTGFNEAFIINGKTKDLLISKSPNSADIIRPILRGRDIKRYRHEFADLWLINTHNGTETLSPIDISNYPAIKEYLDEFYPQLEKRLDKGNTPYNLRSCAYIEDFLKEKIIFQEMVQESSFLLDEKDHFMCLDTGRIIIGNNLKYLLAILNSKLFFFAIKNYYGGGGLGESGIRMKHTFFEKFHCILPSLEIQSSIERLVDEISRMKQENISTKNIENEIDNYIYKIYDLNESEIAKINSSL